MPRTSVRQSSSLETAISFGVLAVLGAVAAWLWATQSHFSPAVTVSVTAAQAAQTSSVTSSSSATAAPQALLSPLPASLQALGPSEGFSPDTLSDKIDGKAELYLSAGFVGMRCQRLAAAADRTAWFEAFIYDMGKPENAFSVYSSQKRTATQEAGLGDYSYRAGNQLCLVHGRYYLELVGASDTAPTLAAAADLARAFVGATKIERHADVTRDEALFPTTDLVPGSVMLLSADVFGFDQLNNTYVARYQQGGDTVTLFLSRRGDPAEAARLAQALRGFFVNDCGGTEVKPPAAPSGAVIVDSGGAFDGTFAVGRFVAGVHQAPSRDAAEAWMRRLNDGLKPAAP